MIGASKILTVSYGTFSCTLEGFDEPFNTMKAIAEYFRDLAAEDRYFGAEPPTPDAAMLHRIAEREIQRRVEAKIQDNGVILRAGDADGPAAVELAPSPTVAAAPAISASGETVADRLSRLRAAQTGISAEPAALIAPVQQVSQAAARDANSYSEDEHADDTLVSVAALARPAAATAAEAAPVIAAPQFADDVQDFDIAEDLQAGPTDFDDLATDTDFASADFTSDDTFAAAMPVDQSYDTAADEALLADLLPEDQPVSQSDDLPEGIALADQADEDMLASVGALIAENDHVVMGAESAASDLIDDAGIDAPYADADLPTAVVAAIEVPVATAVETADLIESTDYAAKFADLDVDGDDQDQDILLASLAALDEQAAADPIEQPAVVETAVAEPETSVADEESPAADKIQRARARVIKIRRVDIADAAAPVQAAPLSLLSPEAEADLQAELAALEAEDLTQPAAPVAPRANAPRPVRNIAVRPVDPTEAAAPAPEADLPTPSQADGRKLLESQNEDDAVSRLLAQANVAMDGEDNRRRRAAIAHLKAAVAATEAERQMNARHPGGKPAADRQDVYRNDLESVVRPKPAEARAAANAERPTPLVLVSEQRIDRPKPATPAASPAAVTAPRVVMPTRPRRIATGSTSLIAVQDDDTLLGGNDDFDDEETLAPEEANLFAEGQSFAEFAEKLGAHTLSDLLEASAVYCAQVLGRPQFTRPLVMRQLEALPDGAAHSREDFMRVFGTLMRQGRIAKVKRGQFAVTDRSPLLAEALRSAV